MPLCCSLHNHLHCLEVIPHDFEVGDGTVSLRGVDLIMSQKILDGDHLSVSIEHLSCHSMSELM